MSFSLQFSHAAPASVNSPLLAIVLTQDPSLDDALHAVDTPLAGAIQRSIARRLPWWPRRDHAVRWW